LSGLPSIIDITDDAGLYSDIENLVLWAREYWNVGIMGLAE